MQCLVNFSVWPLVLSWFVSWNNDSNGGRDSSLCICRADGLYSADVGSSRYLDAGFCGISGDLGKNVVSLSQDSLSEDSLSQDN